MSVVVPVRDGARDIDECLDAIAAQQGSPAFEVIVVDNGSRDATATVARRHRVGARVIEERRPGSYAARNAGLDVAAGDVIAFTDADCRPSPFWLQRGVAAMVGADLVGGAIEMDRDPGGRSWARYDRAMYLDQRHLVEADGFAATANLFVRRAAIEDVGRFDASLRSSGDLEFCRRAVAAGHRLVYAPDAVVHHRPRTTLVATWRLHRRLGAGWAVLAARGEWPRVSDDPALRPRLGDVVSRSAQLGDPARRRELAHVHAVAIAARWAGRLTARG